MSLQLLNQWVKVCFAVLLGVSFVIVFESWFLAIMTWTFLFFFPSQDKELETSASSGIFHFGMALVLFMAFMSSSTFGLGLEIDLSSTLIGGEGFAEFAGTGLGTVLVFALLICIILRGVLSFPKKGGSGEPRSFLWMIDALVYILIVGLLIILEVWTWNTASIIFIGIWIMAFISGSAGDQDSRQTIGVILIIASFVIFSMGVGTQLVGGAFFGQWFPSVYQGITAVTTPFAEIFAGFGEGFQNAFLLITNPTGYAQSIINGSYQKDPQTGLSGALGVELTELRLTPLYAQQPYQAVVKLQNKGSFDAKNVKLTLKFGDKPPPGSTFDVLGFASEDTNKDNKLDHMDVVCSGEGCVQWVDKDKDNELEKIDLRQLFFKSSGVSCGSVVSHNLRERFLPLKARVEYNYKIDSAIELEFISAEEWDRLVKAGKVNIQIKKPAQLKNAPVRLNIDTLQQPIREGTDHFIGINLVSSKPKGKVSNGSIALEFPKEILPAGTDLSKISCYPTDKKKKIEVNAKTGSVVFTWAAEDLRENYLIYCTIPAFDFSGGGPSQTFLIKASANYSFTEEKAFLPGKLEFGGVRCCKNSSSDCIAGQACFNNVCGALTEEQKKELAKKTTEDLTKETTKLDYSNKYNNLLKKVQDAENANQKTTQDIIEIIESLIIDVQLIKSKWDSQIVIMEALNDDSLKTNIEDSKKLSAELVQSISSLNGLLIRAKKNT